MDYWLVLLLGLAVWRATIMLGKESGPLGVFARTRAMLAKRQKRSGGLFDMVSCLSCLSLWVAMVPAALFATNFLNFVLLALVLSAVALIIDKILNSLTKV